MGRQVLAPVMMQVRFDNVWQLFLQARGFVLKKPMNVSTPDGFCLQNEGFCIQKEGFCLQNEGFCIQNGWFCNRLERPLRNSPFGYAQVSQHSWSRSINHRHVLLIRGATLPGVRSARGVRGDLLRGWRGVGCGAVRCEGRRVYTKKRRGVLGQQHRERDRDSGRHGGGATSIQESWFPSAESWFPVEEC